jgi:hypothetical protein
MNRHSALGKRVVALRQRKDAELRAEFKGVGCPYDPLDSRAEAWLAGYRAGLAFAREAVR